MLFNDCTPEELSDRIADKDNFGFVISRSITERIVKELPLRKKTLISLGDLTRDLLTNLLGELRLNNQVANFDIILLFTVFQGGKIYFTYVNSSDCMVNLEY